LDLFVKDCLKKFFRDSVRAASAIFANEQGLKIQPLQKILI